MNNRQDLRINIKIHAIHRKNEKYTSQYYTSQGHKYTEPCRPVFLNSSKSTHEYNMKKKGDR